MALIDIFYNANADKFNPQLFNDQTLCNLEDNEKYLQLYFDESFVSDTCNIVEGDFLLFEYMKHGQNPYEFIASYFEKLCITEKDKIQTVEDFIQFNNVYTKGVKNIRQIFKCLINFMTQNNYDLIFMISSYYFYKI